MFSKKIIASILTFVMIFSFGSVFAQEFSEISADVISKSVADVNNLKIMVGDTDGNFRGEDTITRAEFSVILCRIKGLEDMAISYPGNASFTDTQSHWSKNYVEIARLKDYINGFPDYTFHPDEAVTVAQAAKMLVCVLGYDDSRLKGDFPFGYTKEGESIGLVNGANLPPYYLAEKNAVPATRNFIAFLISNALDIPLRDWVGIDDTGRVEYAIFDGTGDTEYTTLRTETYSN